MNKNNTGKPLVAYFCMEYGLHEDFKIYSGGLGILAGDILKAARDGNYPMVGVGILWRQGYVTQRIGEDGKPMDIFRDYHYDFLEDTGISVKVKIRGRQVEAKVWRCSEYGNAPLYLLDTNLPGNPDALLTGQLYGWFSEERVAQEMLLGIGGVKALDKLGIKPDILHFNDSHPVLAGLELIRRKMDDDGLSFEKAWEDTRRRIVFTTHTPVIAGNEAYDHELLRYMGACCGLTYGQMLQLGGDPFSMTVAGLKLSKISNAVSKLHEGTARKMWKNVTGASEILCVTNGVHNGTWQDGRIVKAMTEESGLLAVHQVLKNEMIAEVQKRNGIKLDGGILTIGFARRAAPYKRSDLIFAKEEVISELFREGKLQIIFSGKAHPNDLGGKDILANLVKMSKKYPDNVVFVEDYDMKIGRLLTRGCDVWLNNPIRTMEASGTSGMKAAMNGVLNVSILDGWWPEGCVHGINGWQIGKKYGANDPAKEGDDDSNAEYKGDDGSNAAYKGDDFSNAAYKGNAGSNAAYNGKTRDSVDAEALYRVLQEEVIPVFYHDRKRWTEMMEKSIEMSQYKFSAARMVAEYYQRIYTA